MLRQDVRMAVLLMLLAAWPLGRVLAQSAPAPAGSAAKPMPRPDELEPAVDTTRSAPTSAAAPESLSGTRPCGRAPTRAAAAAAPHNAAAAKDAPPKAAAKKGVDRLNLETTDVTGNSELPKVHVHRALEAVGSGRPGRPARNSLLDEVLQPVDRDVFRRENRYYDALKPQAAEAKPDAAQGSGVKP